MKKEKNRNEKKEERNMLEEKKEKINPNSRNDLGCQRPICLEQPCPQ